MARQLWPAIRRVWITVGLGATAIFVVWSLVAYRANAEARQATESDANVTVTHAAGIWRFQPTGVAMTPTLVFFPGALVDPRAYAPLARAVAQRGFPVILVELPRRGMFGGAESSELRRRVDATLSFLGESGSVVLGGHSRGAVVASAVAAGPPPTLVGLVLIGTSHPRDVDLSGLDVPVTKIVGTRDGLATPAEVRGNASLLPPQTRWIWVDGGNHSQFGWYGFQPMDRRPRVSAAEQRSAMLDGVLDLLRAAGTATD
jgi:pimeloyl-ACP methyl ester carboxylesterase